MYLNDVSPLVVFRLHFNEVQLEMIEMKNIVKSNLPSITITIKYVI